MQRKKKETGEGEDKEMYKMRFSKGERRPVVSPLSQREWERVTATAGILWNMGQGTPGMGSRGEVKPSPEAEALLPALTFQVADKSFHETQNLGASRIKCTHGEI